MSDPPSYRATHWGERGPVRERRLSAPDPKAGELFELGQLVSLVYLTVKWGDTELTEYEHAFSRPRPILAYGPGGLVICGGRYKVGIRGIYG